MIVAAIAALPFAIFLLFFAVYVCVTPSAWTMQTRALIAAACCAAALSCLHVAYRFLRPRAPQRLASTFLLMFSGVIIFFGLAVAVPGVAERNVDAIFGGLLFLALGAGGVAQVVRRIVSGTDAEAEPSKPDFANRPAFAPASTAADLDAAQRMRRVAILLVWCILAVSVYVGLFTALPGTVTVLTVLASLVPYVVSIKFIEPRLLRRGSR